MVSPDDKAYFVLPCLICHTSRHVAPPNSLRGSLLRKRGYRASLSPHEFRLPRWLQHGIYQWPIKWAVPYWSGEEMAVMDVGRMMADLLAHKGLGFRSSSPFKQRENARS